MRGVEGDSAVAGVIITGSSITTLGSSTRVAAGILSSKMFASVSGMNTGSSTAETRSPNIAVEGVSTSGMITGSSTTTLGSSTRVVVATLSSNTAA